MYRSAGVQLYTAFQQGAQKFDIAWRCKNCGTTGVAENAYSNSNDLKCHECRTEIPASQKKEILRPAGFTSDFYEPTSNDISSQKYIRVERPRIQLEGDSLNLPDSRCGFIRYGHNGSVFYHSSGENEKGYAICMECGRSESMSADGEIPKFFAPPHTHRPLGGKTQNGKLVDCAGHIKPHLHLGYKIQTDVLEIYLRNPLTGEWLTDSGKDQIIATTLAVALRDAIADELGIASTEMGFGSKIDRDTDTGQTRSVIQVFDLVSGGAGFVVAGVANIARLMRLVLRKLECRSQCENVCSHCLASQDSRVEYEELDRRAARQWLFNCNFQDYLHLPDQFSIVQGAEYCSQTALQFIQSSINKLPMENTSKTIRIFMSGDSRGWDLAHPIFRDKLLSWKATDQLGVELIIEHSKDLDEESQRNLKLLSGLGIKALTTGDVWSSNAPYLMIQVYTDSNCFSLFASSTDFTEPGEHWLRQDEACTLVSSRLIPASQVSPVDMSSWGITQTGSTVVEITSELNGSVLSLCKRLKKIVEQQVPEFAQLLEQDSAVAISYSDRYLKSPWSLLLLSGFLYLFKSDDLERVEIQSLRSIGKENSYQIKHDWIYEEDQGDILSKWLKLVLGCVPDLSLKDKPWELLHGRVITIEWKSGKQSRILLDQGMGYWQPRAMYRDELEFDFSASATAQTEEMANKFKAINMVNSGSWPTYMSFTSEV
ncbi:DUF1998 domain-containing protein [Sansalvadorimonas verongulae]|uniref:DUF1998 domain-containing protein n=1 Tax=Sansalvadorimonas verongulae TaxID=2172824 RepID=UPI0012BBB7DC|nr:DUF1998 domain-containing protein [Sansalvadorimonas verongulae]MTI11858.1 DUF1998 domain-containing protein [Sansalvadorimonas verongulae]